MKQIVLSEGRNDVSFVSSFFNYCGGTFHVKKFHGEDADGHIQTEESQEIKNFRERRNPYHVLVKSENGKPNLKKIFAALVSQLMRIDPEIVVIVDLDGGSLKGFVNDLNEQVQERHSGKGVELGDHSIVERNTDMVAAECEVVTGDGKQKGEFQILAFKQTLERVANVSHDDGIEDRKEQIKQFLNEDHVYDMLDAILPASE